jgi:hypothetical protein
VVDGSLCPWLMARSARGRWLALLVVNGSLPFQIQRWGRNTLRGGISPYQQLPTWNVNLTVILSDVTVVTSDSAYMYVASLALIEIESITIIIVAD